MQFDKILFIILSFNYKLYMDKDQKWFVMAGVLNLLVGGYIVSEVIYKWSKKKKEDESNRKLSFK